ncbi:MAG TPA: outer membrane beta-barrel protein [Bryobacteraceae bacterium]|nr:outer membrane beta-barrel protein [Bryobacteraceae bacterium]
MKLIHTIPVFLLFTAGIPFAHAQAGSFNVHAGLGTATDSSSNQQIDTFGTGIPYTTPKMGGLFADLGADFMFSKHYGVGADLSWKGSQGAYAGLNYRPLFYTFDAIVEPTHSKRFVPELRAGLGGVSLRYSYTQRFCDQFTGCSTSNQYLESSNHFQAHMEAAARFYVTDRVFVRPAVEAHYINNFFQFGSNWVPQYSIGVGYSFGNRE